MNTKEINIAGTTVVLAYTFATEIAYKSLNDEDINEYMADAYGAIKEQRLPDIKSTIFLILAAAMAYAEAKGIECTITDASLMNDATPEELGTALGVVIGLRNQFYRVPSGEPEDKTVNKKNV